jgi:integrase
LRACNAYRQLAEFAGLPSETCSSLRGSYSASEVDPRYLPEDELIAQWRAEIKDPGWQWVSGMLATYGLRPHEVYSCDLADFPTVRVYEGTKTGSRFCWPLYPEWADSWNLVGRVDRPLELARGYSNAQLGTKTSKFFERWGNCQAYDLRHSYARRCLEFGFSPEFGAKMMGHSPETHCRVYRRWIDEGTCRAIYQAGIDRQNRPQPPEVRDSPIYKIPTLFPRRRESIRDRLW